MRWARHADLVDAATAVRLDGGDSALRTAVELREAIFQVFSAIGRGDAVPAASLAVVQARYAEAAAAGHLVSRGSGFVWDFDGSAPGRAWWPLAISAVELLTHGPLERVKVCALQTSCIGLFLDTTKNRSRRWCTTEGCCLDAKLERQAARRKAARAAG
ncbi:hypothetical protein Ade02nite_94820 [Paractinoplanes deccanensis]|uniref:Zinc finger CGNR domain-containing protein n=1 Tax=Paractinoplanes deccanensis TaxID=113561 RepID=A0ABQ3YLG9_9ACTN|nr:hypothetical protein Ade02nite_94820 [Actinoplanes deccanensis]